MGIAEDSQQRTIYQIVDKQGKPSVAAHTMPLWVDKSDTDVFSLPTEGNKVLYFTCGKEYFSNLIAACDQARSEIYLAGWQVAWDALLAPGVRLYDLLLRCAKRGVRIYVMPWNDTEPVQTYDDQTKKVLESINDLLADGSKGRIVVTLCSSFAGVNNSYFSHHQKQVVIDRKIAYVGGMDVCYGRFDDATFSLRAAGDGRQVMNRYNPGIPYLKNVEANTPLVDPDLMSGAADKFGVRVGRYTVVKSSASEQLEKIAKGGWQVPYGKAGTAGVLANTPGISANTAQKVEVDESRQPRMPWQDIHCRIEGPSVSPLLKNFILRWNAATSDKEKKLARELPPTAYEKVGKANIQVLRSAPAAHCQKEREKNPGSESKRGQHDIYVAMKNLIAKATRFIYIENQFFVSDFGEIGGPSSELSPAAAHIKNGAGGISDSTLYLVRTTSKGNSDQLPQNTILKALLNRLKRAILDDISKPKFHIYITLPVHPEGPLSDASIAVQVYYTMQTLVFGSHSLINGIKRLIKARELKDKKDNGYMRALDVENREYESVSDDACFQYVTLLNLRNWEKLGQYYVTEQIYVHSKLMIVDDRFALLGSANINDRSLLGERDSELAVLIMDDDTSRADINGKGSNQPVRAFAHELRKASWNKLFGITGGVRPALDLKAAVEQPGHPDSWKLIQRRAVKNKLLYEAAFPFIPRDNSPFPESAGAPGSILPTWDDNQNQHGGIRLPLPFQDAFWSKPQHTAAASELSEVKGFITAIPLSWTKNENIRIKYPTAIIVKNDSAPPVEEGTAVYALAGVDRNKSEESNG
jgi:phospholipase D1/2